MDEGPLPPAPADSVTPADVDDAAGRLEGIAHLTPVLTSRTLDERVGARVFLKCENLQRAGAFKFRGAYNTISRLDDAQRRRGVVAFSSGNHAQGVALAAQLLGAPAVIVMPTDAPAVKLEATRGYGAEVVLHDRHEGKREEIAQRLSRERELAIVPPFNHPHIVAGQGTATRELLAQAGELDVLVAPVGGGGLVSGACIAARAACPGARIYGVEPEQANDAWLSLQRGEIVTTAQASSVADGLLPVAIGPITFAIMRRHLAGMVLVSDDEILDAVRFLAARVKLVVEPSGAAGVAALLAGRVPEARGARIGVILSGGNVDPRRLGAMLAGADVG